MDLGPGDLLYFPGQCFHEVHNLTSDSKAITNAVPWPKESKNKEEEKEPKVLKSEFKRKLKVVENYESR